MGSQTTQGLCVMTSSANFLNANEVVIEVGQALKLLPKTANVERDDCKLGSLPNTKKGRKCAR
eukprot:1897372-Amphidinium_carterae.1